MTQTATDKSALACIDSNALQYRHTNDGYLESVQFFKPILNINQFKLAVLKVSCVFVITELKLHIGINICSKYAVLFVVEMAIIRCTKGVQGYPDFVLPAL